MNRTVLKFLSVGMIALAITTASHADVVIGDYEGGSTDGWTPPSDSTANPVVTNQTGPFATKGTDNVRGTADDGSFNPATTGVGALKIAAKGGTFWGAVSPNLITNSAAMGALQLSGTRFSFQMSMLGDQLDPRDNDSFDGFAQSNEMALQLFAPADTSTGYAGMNLFLQIHMSTGHGTDTLHSGSIAQLNLRGQYNGQDGTRTLSYLLNDLLGDDPTIAGTDSTPAFLIIQHNLSHLTNVQLRESTQVGNDSTSDPSMGVDPDTGIPNGFLPPTSVFYMDNVRLVIPEPATLALFGFALPALAMRRRRST